MKFFRKDSIICPVCGSQAPKVHPMPDIIYRCDKCDFISCDEKCVDVSYGDEFSAPLSNLYPHKFKLYSFYSNSLPEEFLTCLSMESFLQSLKIKDPDLQNEFFRTYSGFAAEKMGGVLDGWKKDQILYFEGKPYHRESDEFDELITRAYDDLFESNDIFREVVLPIFKDYQIIHTIGHDRKAETILTEAEYRYQINRLIAKLG